MESVPIETLAQILSGIGIEEIIETRSTSITFKLATNNHVTISILSDMYDLPKNYTTFESFLEAYDRKYITPRCLVDEYHNTDICGEYFIKEDDIKGLENAIKKGYNNWSKILIKAIDDKNENLIIEIVDKVGKDEHKWNWNSITNHIFGNLDLNIIKIVFSKNAELYYFDWGHLLIPLVELERLDLIIFIFNKLNGNIHVPLQNWIIELNEMIYASIDIGSVNIFDYIMELKYSKKIWQWDNIFEEAILSENTGLIESVVFYGGDNLDVESAILNSIKTYNIEIVEYVYLILEVGNIPNDIDWENIREVAKSTGIEEIINFFN